MPTSVAAPAVGATAAPLSIPVAITAVPSAVTTTAVSPGMAATAVSPGMAGTRTVAAPTVAVLSLAVSCCCCCDLSRYSQTEMKSRYSRIPGFELRPYL